MKKNIKLFTTPDCGSCRSIKQWLPELAKKLGVLYQEVDCIKSPKLANQFSVQTVPTVVINNSHTLLIPKITAQRIIEIVDKDS